MVTTFFLLLNKFPIVLCYYIFQIYLAEGHTDHLFTHLKMHVIYIDTRRKQWIKMREIRGWYVTSEITVPKEHTSP